MNYRSFLVISAGMLCVDKGYCDMRLRLIFKFLSVIFVQNDDLGLITSRHQYTKKKADICDKEIPSITLDISLVLRNPLGLRGHMSDGSVSAPAIKSEI